MTASRMELSRRSLMAGAAVAYLGNGALLRGAAHRTSMGLATDSVPTRRRMATADFVDLVGKWGMGGAQAPLTSLDSAYAQTVRARLEKWGLFLVVSASINDLDRFRQTVALAKEAGAVGVRVPSGGRRYEDFSTLAERQAHVTAVRERLRLAIPVAEAAKLPIALENHKDFTLEEEVRLLKEYSSEYFGACVDTGNNLALLDDPMDVVEQLAPFAVTTHLKDATLEEYEDGFLLGDIPLGEGMMDLPRVVQTLKKHHPRLPILLECITRNPLQIPCLTDKYWATFPERNGLYLARALKLARVNKPRWQISIPPNAEPGELEQQETKNVEMCIAYARDKLGLL